MIEIWLDGCAPPAGRVVTGPEEEPMRFDGWLQLLHVLADAMTRDRPSGTEPAVP